MKKECARVLNEIPISKQRGRKDVYTIDLKQKFLPGTDMKTLLQTGTLELDAYVNSGFRTLPSKTIFRTDARQSTVEDLCATDIANILQPVLVQENVQFVNDSVVPVHGTANESDHVVL